MISLWKKLPPEFPKISRHFRGRGSQPTRSRQVAHRTNSSLTARVAMNWMWHQVFGVGIVKTVNDFGSQAEWPTHPELLDWLAAEFVESGWDRKAMHKMMILSSAYRQSSDTNSDLMDRDPENRLLARGPRKRLSAEMVRDQFLAMSGLLSRKIGGPSAKPYQPPGLWKELTNRKGFQQVYEADTGEGLYRRGLYTFWKRAAHHPMMSTFDAPESGSLYLQPLCDQHPVAGSRSSP